MSWQGRKNVIGHLARVALGHQIRFYSFSGKIIFGNTSRKYEPGASPSENLAERIRFLAVSMSMIRFQISLKSLRSRWPAAICILQRAIEILMRFRVCDSRTTRVRSSYWTCFYFCWAYKFISCFSLQASSVPSTQNRQVSDK